MSSTVCWEVGSHTCPFVCTLVPIPFPSCDMAQPSSMGLSGVACLAAKTSSCLQVDYTDSFRLFCTTRLPNPHYTPELSAKVTLVDFTVTMAGLEDQLLGKLILKEKHELEEQRQGLMEEVQSYKKKIKQLEDDLLYRLSNSQVRLPYINSMHTALFKVWYCKSLGSFQNLSCLHNRCTQGQPVRGD